MSESSRARRADRMGQHNTAYLKNARRVLASQDYCGICGRFVDKRLKRPDPMAPEVDHIIPIAAGGHPSDIDNLQLTHARCNRLKGAGAVSGDKNPNKNQINWSFNWYEYKA